MTKQVLAATCSFALLLGACQTTAPRADGHIPPGHPSNETVGAVMGGTIGGILGGQIGEGSGKTTAAVVGALLGAWAGSRIAAGMTPQDRQHYSTASTKAENVPVGQTVEWYNPQSGNSGTITPTREGPTNYGEYCREFQQTVTIDGETQRAYGTACRQPDGSWKIVN
ncbi:MAG: RT0821/Lpp0805 family surface protein [Alphaproteobacteria bacterium]|nr:RT0821/Lpp0805 family surface protein [Alphaproteobacteria bacterium]MDD9919163.1 RT0821/Lpp0805 family surface protein [Alphaproteobacteria bacterium]